MIPPLTKWINDIKVKLGFSRTMTAAGADVVDAVNKQYDQIGDLGPYNGLDSDSIKAALAAAQGKALNGLLQSEITLREKLITYDNLAGDANANNQSFLLLGVHIYKGNWSNSRLNFPTGFNAGVLVTVGGTDMNWQFACPHDSTNLYFRTYFETWKEWKLL